MTAKRLLVSGGPITTLDPIHPHPEAVLVEDGRVLALGRRADLATHWGAGASTLDLEGRAVVPGLTDSHLHLLSYGLVLEQVQLTGVTGLPDLVARVAERASELPEGEWILGRGWDQDLFAERRYPTRHNLDRAAPGRPVLLVRGCGHCSVVSSKALELARITADTPDPPGGMIERDPATGAPTGVLHERAAGLVREIIPAPSYEAKQRALHAALRLALSAGLTACHPDDVRNAGDFATAWRLYQDVLAQTAGPRIRVEVSDFAMEELLALGMRTGSGTPMLSVGAIKAFVDGSLGARSAALTEPYSDGPGSGILVRERAEFMETIRRAHTAGMQVAIHAIGDLGVDWALDGIEAAQKALPSLKLRHRVVHAQITRPDQLPRFVNLGAVAEIQPKFVTTDKLWVESRVGLERARHSYCWKTMLRSGVRCAGGSDGPVEPLHPLLGIYAAVTRSGMDGSPECGWLPDERLAVDEALRLFALGGAYAAGAESWRGSLSPGKVADFVVLDRSLDSVSPHEIKDVAVEMTYIGGQKVFSKS